MEVNVNLPLPAPGFVPLNSNPVNDPDFLGGGDLDYSASTEPFTMPNSSFDQSNWFRNLLPTIPRRLVSGWRDRIRLQVIISVGSLIVCAAEVPLLKAAADSLRDSGFPAFLFFLLTFVQLLCFGGGLLFKIYHGGIYVWPQSDEWRLISVISTCDCLSIVLILATAPYVPGYVLPIVLQSRFMIFTLTGKKIGIQMDSVATLGVIFVGFGCILVLVESFLENGLTSPSHNSWWRVIILVIAAGISGFSDVARCAHVCFCVLLFYRKFCT